MVPIFWCVQPIGSAEAKGAETVPGCVPDFAVSDPGAFDEPKKITDMAEEIVDFPSSERSSIRWDVVRISGGRVLAPVITWK